MESDVGGSVVSKLESKDKSMGWLDVFVEGVRLGGCADIPVPDSFPDISPESTPMRFKKVSSMVRKSSFVETPDAGSALIKAIRRVRPLAESPDAEEVSNADNKCGGNIACSAGVNGTGRGSRRTH